MSAELPSSDVQRAVVKAIVNGVLSDIFLWGLYTVVYIGTLYIYLSKKSSQHWVVIGTISLSYLVYVLQEITNWYTFQWNVVNSSQSSEALFLGLALGDGEATSKWPTFVNDLCTFLLAALADGLLIWRCFNVWDHSLRAILIPSFLLFCEIVVDIIIIIITCAEHLNPSLNQGLFLNKLLGSSAFLTFAATLTSTFLISYRIQTLSNQEIPKGSRVLVKRILEILIQSATAYSVATLANAIATVIPYTDENAPTLYAAQSNSYHLSLFAAGVSPTIMVARVTFLDNAIADGAGGSRISTLQFRARSAIQNATTFYVERGDIGSSVQFESSYEK